MLITIMFEMIVDVPGGEYVHADHVVETQRLRLFGVYLLGFHRPLRPVLERCSFAHCLPHEMPSPGTEGLLCRRHSAQ